MSELSNGENAATQVFLLFCFKFSDRIRGMGAQPCLFGHWLVLTIVGGCSCWISHSKTRFDFFDFSKLAFGPTTTFTDYGLDYGLFDLGQFVVSKTLKELKTKQRKAKHSDCNFVHRLPDCLLNFFRSI